METNNDFTDTFLNLVFGENVIPEVGRAIPVITGLSASAEPSPLIDQICAIGSLISAGDMLRIETELLNFRSQSDSYVVISEETLDVVRKLEPLIPKEEKKEFEEIVTPPKNGKEKHLDWDKVSKLIQLIVAIVTIIYYTHDMALKIAEKKQQQAEDDIKQKEIELSEDALELVDEFFEYIKENGICVPGQADGFAEQVEPFGEPVDIFNNSAVSGGHSDKGDELGDVQNIQE